MNRRSAPAVYTLLLTFIVGLWLTISPFIMKAQPVGAMWSRGTINDVVVGAILAIAALGGIGAYLALGLRDLVRAAEQRSEETAAQPTP
jgi:hypothetical protein